MLSGKGQFVCAAFAPAPACDATGLMTFEAPFAYTERGERKLALVKLRLCARCAQRAFAAPEVASEEEEGGRGQSVAHNVSAADAAGHLAEAAVELASEDAAAAAKPAAKTAGASAVEPAAELVAAPATEPALPAGSKRYRSGGAVEKPF